MNPLFVAALEAQAFMRERGWSFCIIGGLALARWGEPRATQAVDLALLAGFGDEETFVDGLLGRFRGRVDRAREFALANRTVLLAASNGVSLDLSLAGVPFEAEAVARASVFPFAPDVDLVTCSAEDLVVMKAFAARERDWLDLEGLLVRQGAALEWAYVQRHLHALAPLKPGVDIVDRLAALRVR